MAYFIRAMRARKLHFVLQLSPSIGIRRYCHDQNYPFRLNGYHHKTVSMHRNAVSNKSNIRHVQNHHRRQFLWAFSCYSPVHWSAVCVCVKKKETPRFVLFHYWLIADDCWAFATWPFGHIEQRTPPSSLYYSIFIYHIWSPILLYSFNNGTSDARSCHCPIFLFTQPAHGITQRTKNTWKKKSSNTANWWYQYIFPPQLFYYIIEHVFVHRIIFHFLFSFY